MSLIFTLGFSPENIIDSFGEIFESCIGEASKKVLLNLVVALNDPSFVKQFRSLQRRFFPLCPNENIPSPPLFSGTFQL